MPIVATHVRKFGLSDILKVWIILWHGQPVHIGANGNSLYAFRSSFARPADIDHKTGANAVTDLLGRNAQFK